LILDDKALEVNNLTREQIATFPDERWVARAYQNFVATGDDLRFVGFNAPYDLEMIAAFLERQGIGDLGFVMPWLDLLPESRKHLKPANLNNHKLVTVSKHLGIDTEGAHDAMFDVYACLQIMRHFRARGYIEFDEIEVAA
jgi:DNA polymerase III epsilon subunit-like protein